MSQSLPKSRGIPGLKRLILGIALLVLGVLMVPLAIAATVFLVFQNHSEEARLVIPGRVEVAVTEPGRYYLWHDYQTTFEGRSVRRSDGPPGGLLEVSVEDSGGEALHFSWSDSVSVSRGGHRKRSIGYVQVDAPATLVISVTGDAEGCVLSFGQSRVPEILGIVFGGLALAAVVGLSGLGIAVWGGLKMLKKSGDGGLPSAGLA